MKTVGVALPMTSPDRKLNVALYDANARAPPFVRVQYLLAFFAGLIVEDPRLGWLPAVVETVTLPAALTVLKVRATDVGVAPSGPTKNVRLGEPVPTLICRLPTMCPDVRLTVPVTMSVSFAVLILPLVSVRAPLTLMASPPPLTVM